MKMIIKTNSIYHKAMKIERLIRNMDSLDQLSINSQLVPGKSQIWNYTFEFDVSVNDAHLIETTLHAHFKDTNYKIEK
jgi:hypothetical protein